MAWGSLQIDREQGGEFLEEYVCFFTSGLCKVPQKFLSEFLETFLFMKVNDRHLVLGSIT